MNDEDALGDDEDDDEDAVEEDVELKRRKRENKRQKSEHDGALKVKKLKRNDDAAEMQVQQSKREGSDSEVEYDPGVGTVQAKPVPAQPMVTLAPTLAPPSNPHHPVGDANA